MKMRLTALLLLFILSPLKAIYAAEYYEKALTSFNENKVDDAYIHLKNALKENPDNLPAKILMGKVLLNKKLFQDGIIEFQEALQLGGDANLFIFDLGKALLLTGAYQEVIDLDNGLKLNLKNQVHCLLLKGNAYMALNDYNEAFLAYEQANILMPTDERPMLALSSLALTELKYIEAEKLIKQALEIAPDNSRAWQLKGELHTALQQQNEALIALEKAYTLDNEDPMIKRSLAQHYTRNGNYQAAIILVEQIVEDTPNDPFAKLLHSQLLTYNNKNEESQAMLADISAKLSLLTEEQKRNNVYLAYVSGVSAYYQGKLELAQKELTYYVNEKPNDLAGINLLVDIYLQQGQIARVQDFLEKKESIISGDLKLSLKLVNIYLENNNLYKANRILSNTQSVYHNHFQYVMAKANYLAKSKRFDESLQLLDQYSPKEFNSAYQLTRGFIYFAKNDIQQANKLADELREYDAENTNFLNFKGLILLKQNQWPEAIAIFEKILATNPENFSSLFNVATAYAAMGKYEDASQITKNLLKRAPENVSVQILLAKIERDTQQTDSAIKLLKTVLILDETNSTAADTLLDIYYQQGEYELALEEAERLNKINFLNPTYIEKKARILIQLKKYDSAKQQLGILLGTLGQAEDFFKLSYLQIAAQDIEGAKKSLDLAISQKPDSVIYQLELTKLDILQSNFDAAEKRLQKLSAAHKNNPNILLVQGELFSKQGKLELAQKQYMQALKLDNNFDAPLVALYKLTLKNIGVKSFNTEATIILSRNPDNALMRNLLADNLLNSGDFQGAKTHYLALLKNNNLINKAAILNNLANIELTESLDKALEYANEALSQNSNSASFLDTKGWILSLQGKNEEALKLLRQAHAMNASDPVISYHIGYTLHKMGRNDEAIRELEKSINVMHDFREKQDATTLLNTIK